MKPVMLATDGSPTAEKATATAIDLARLLDTELIVVSVWDIAYAGFGAMGFAPIPTNADLARLGEEDARRALDRAVVEAEQIQTTVCIVEQLEVTQRVQPRGDHLDAVVELANGAVLDHHAVKAVGIVDAVH